MSEITKLETYVHVTIANLNKPGSFVTSNRGNGFTVSGWKVLMEKAVFIGKVLGTKVKHANNHILVDNLGSREWVRERTRNLLG
jgi:hypothetical protein